MNKPVALVAVAALSVTLLAACGNKGPLVRPSDIPPPAEAMPAVAPAPAPATDGTVLPDTTPPAQPPITDVVAPPPAQGDGD